MSQFKQLMLSVDWMLVLAVLILPSMGLMVLYSASFDPDVGMSTHFWKQFTYFVVGSCILVVTACIPPRFWFRYSYVFYVLVLVLLATVLLYGTISNGSRRWLALGPVNIQPSELMKVGVVLALARFLAKFPPKKQVYGMFELFVPIFLILLPPMLVIFKQPDLGTALTVGAIGVGMLLFVGVKRWILISVSLLACVSATSAFFFLLHPYQQKRITTLFDPESDPHGSGWQIIQSKIAVGSGELFGKGYLQGSQTQLEFIPERTTDFIFCVLAEEWGFVGSICVLGFYFFLLSRILYGVSRSKDYFGAMVGVGVTVLIFFHTFVNLGMVVGFLPVVGLPLPLFSYGGSSLLTTLFAVGLVLSVTSPRSVFSNR